MRCKLCDVEVGGKFYLHLNSRHRMKKDKYLNMFPEQMVEYAKQVPAVWNKGETKETNSKMAKIAEGMVAYANQEDIKKQRSQQLKKRYEAGDILDAETRSRVVKAGNDGWTKKVSQATSEVRAVMLKPFVDAGNRAQQEMRSSLTPEDYERLYPFAKGHARWHNCDQCGKNMIAWFGGKPRPKRRFCNKDCFSNYKMDHPGFVWQTCGSPYYSEKMGVEFYLRSSLERWFAKMLDDSATIHSWGTVPFVIPFIFEDKTRRYHPDFLVNDRHVIELKSGYVASMNQEKTKLKIEVAEKYCRENGYEFHYWQFDQNNMTEAKFMKDERVKSFNKKDYNGFD